MKLAYPLFAAALCLSACGSDDAGNAHDGTTSHRDGGTDSDAATPAHGDDAGAAGHGGDGAGDHGTGQPGMVNHGDIGATLGTAASAPWTVFVYGHADHSLSNSFVRDLAEMASAKISKDVHVVVLADFDASQTIADTGEKFPDGVQWLEVHGSGADPETIATEEELDLDDPDVLSAAVAAAFTHFPSERRALVLWDHGGSWIGGFGGDTQNGTDPQPKPMAPAQVASAVAKGMHDAGIADGEKLDLFSFDTCLMAGAEVVWAFRDLTDVYIANAEIDYGDGWDYKGFLTHLSQHTTDSSQAIATQEVALWDAHHVHASFNDALLRSHVALDTAALPAFAQSIDTFVQSWLGSRTLNGVELGRASFFSLPPYMNELESPASTPQLRDVGQFLRSMQVVSDPTVASAAEAARGALEDAIVARSQGDLREAAMQLGMHVELPLAASMSDALFSAYRDRASAWIDDSSWLDALRAYDQLDDGTKPDIAGSIINNQDPDGTHLPTVQFSVANDDVAEAEVDIALVDPNDSDQLAYFGIVGKSAIDSNGSFEFPWNGQLVALPDGDGGLQAVYMTIWEDTGADTDQSAPPVLAIFGSFQTSDGSSSLGALLFQDGDQETSLLSLFDPPLTLTLANVASDLPGSTFSPVLETYTISLQQQSQQLGEPITIDGPSIPINQGPAAGGSYALVTSVTDVFGNVASDVQLTKVMTPIQ